MMVNGEMTREMTMVYHKSGDVYVGKWRDDKIDGFGKMTYGANVYVGNFRDGKRCGHGTFTWKSGNVYVGNWRDDKRCGDGTIGIFALS